MLRTLASAILVPFLVVWGECYEVATHRDLVRAAAGRSMADRLLRDDLGMAEGFDTNVQGKAI